MQRFTRFITIALCTLAIIAVPALVFAGTQEPVFVVAADEVIDGNIITARNYIEIKGAVNGDVIVAGSTIVISGPVSGDVIVAGNSVTVSGAVGGSIRAVGNAVTVSGTVGHTIWAAGNSVAIAPSASTGWDVYAAGQTVAIDGPIARNAWLAGAVVSISDTIGGKLTAALDQSGQLILNEKAVVTGDLAYKAVSDDQLIVREGAKVTGATTRSEHPVQVQAPKAYTIFIFLRIIAYFNLLLVGLVLIGLLPKQMNQIGELLLTKPATSLGWGALFFFVTPIVAGILFITIIGIPLALILFAAYAISLYTASIIAAYAIGRWVLAKLTKKLAYEGNPIFALVVGLLIFIVIVSIPVLGWILKILFIMLALGALLMVKRSIWQQLR